MADDLSDLDELAPAGTDLQNLGDDAIRDTRRKVINWADIEHHLTGEHKFIMGAPAWRPAAGYAGRIWVDTTNNRVEYDNSAVWRMLRAVQAYRNVEPGSITLTVSWQDLVSQTIDVIVGGRVLAMFQGLVTTAGVCPSISVKIAIDGVDQSPGALVYKVASSSATWFTYTSIDVTGTLSTGSKTVTAKALRSGSGDAITMTARNLYTLVL